MNIFVDCDILLDVALGREPFRLASGDVLDYLEEHSGQGFIAWHSVANLYYVGAKLLGKEPAKAFIVRLCQFIQVVPTGTREVLQAAQLPMADFEDALQSAAATACGASVIVTRNINDYLSSPVSAISPETLLDQLPSQE
jgi:hypothetical protein